MLHARSSTIKIGKIVQTYVRDYIANGNLSAHELEQMQSIRYSKEIFRIHGNEFAVLSRSRTPRERYYATPIFINNMTYYLSSQWYDDQLPYVLTWLKKHNIEI